MRKVVCSLLSVIMLLSLSTVYAEGMDLSGLSFDELIALKDKINLAIWNSQEWQEVTVPQGEWVVGQDIPVGKWTIKCADVNHHDYMMKECDIEWGFLKSNGYIDSYTSRGGGDVSLYNPNHDDYKSGQITEVFADLQEGMIVRIREAYAPALFTPYAGKPSLGFN